ncbi:peptidoglycan-binding protein [Streptomyces sp. HK10]|uniref:peptidoglycan-binding domain-containing protein n=1 Tax=Streptomyces sp. HK10 TaxID=3373255 RepID=UPI0037478AA8
MLALGDRGSAVRRLQQLLREAGLLSTPVTGLFDQPTEAAVQNYQALHGVQDDPPGVYGPTTRALLEGRL